MVDIKDKIVESLEATGIDVFYELFVDSNTPIPCVTYIESNNSDNKKGTNLEYSNLDFQIKIWSRNVSDISNYSNKIDTEMKKLGFNRTSSNELVFNGIIQKIFKYSAIAYEYKNNKK